MAGAQDNLSRHTETKGPFSCEWEWSYLSHYTRESTCAGLFLRNDATRCTCSGPSGIVLPGVYMLSPIFVFSEKRTSVFFVHITMNRIRLSRHFLALFARHMLDNLAAPEMTFLFLVEPATKVVLIEARACFASISSPKTIGCRPEDRECGFDPPS